MTTKTTANDLREILTIAADHLRQYRQYAEDMRAIGRGASISSAFQPDTLATIIDQALATSTPKRPRTVDVGPVDTSTMSTADLYAYYKRTAPIEDLRFFLQAVTMPNDVFTRALALSDSGDARRIKAELPRLHAEWRRATGYAPLFTAEELAAIDAPIAAESEAA